MFSDNCNFLFELGVVVEEKIFSTVKHLFLNVFTVQSKKCHVG